MEQVGYRRAFNPRYRDNHGNQDGNRHGEPVEFASLDPIPLFLSDPGGAPEPEEFLPAERTGRARIAAPVVAAGLVLGAAALLIVLSQADASRSLVGQATASINSLGEQRPTHPGGEHVVDANRGVALAQTPTAQASDAPAAAIPSRDAIANAYRSALQNRTVAAAGDTAGIAAAIIAPVHEATPVSLQKPIPTLDADTLASLMKRANGLLAVGDINGARLLLERAANAQDAAAALLLAQTYDPAVLGVRDIRSVAPDPAMARDWYQKASRLGSRDAQQRLAQLGN